jgi:hypothetical protein
MAERRNKTTEENYGSQAEVVQDLQNIRNQLVKIGGETVSLQTNIDTLNVRIRELEDLLANAEVPQAIVDAVAAVKAQAQVVDDSVPDVPTPPTP